MAGDERNRLVYDVVRRHRRGESKRRIAKVVGIARKTVTKILEEHGARLEHGDDALARQLPKPRAPRASKLDPHIDFIAAQVEEFADITAQRVWEKLVDEGFDGGYTLVRDSMRQLRPKPAKRAHDPVRTPAGKQGQCDWSPHTLPGCKIKVQTFSLVLHFSSHQYVDFARDKPQIVLFRQLKAAFEDFRGVPAEIVFDSEKTVVDRWENGEPVLNLGMMDFAAYYGFENHIAPRADGAYKGGVERPFWTVEQNFFTGRSFKDFDDARARVARWRDTFARRPHGTKRRTRVEMFEQEQPKLQPLPAHPYDTSEIVWRIVDGYHSVLFDTNTYTVPRAYVGFRLCIRANEDTVQVYDNAVRLLTTHSRLPHGAHAESELPEHRRKRRIDIEKIVERFELWGEAAASFAHRLRARQRLAGVELSCILALQAEYRLEDILAAIEHALAYDACQAKALTRILQVHAKPLTLEDVVTRRIRDDIRKALAKTPVRQRALETYQDVLTKRGEPDTEEDDEPKGHDTD
jgi:transposase